MSDVDRSRPKWWWSNKRRGQWWDTRPAPTLTAKERADEAWFERMTEAHERAFALPCLDCEVGEPHACERLWWQQQIAHQQGHVCSDPECMCHIAADLERQAYELKPISYLDVKR